MSEWVGVSSKSGCSNGADSRAAVRRGSSYHLFLRTQAEAVIQKARAIMQLPSVGTMAMQLDQIARLLH